MKKVFDQTVRDIKREVNKKVLKVPGIEQKVLDATSNEPWGPHGSLLADIAQATRNYHEYQMIMSIIWKRLSDTGKNWRHVYKALIVLEYMVAHGSERVIDDIKEHAYQISTLSDFQYIDSSGRDQGSNVRKKSQSLVALVNDKERIIEVRQKAAANRDKFRNTSSPGGMYRPGSYSSTGGYGDKYDDDRYEGRYGGRDEDRNGYGYGRERELGYRDDDRYGKQGDSYSRDGDRYGREYDERNGREDFRDDDYRGRSRSVDDCHDSRSRSSDRERERSVDDDGQYSSRGSGARADDQSQDGRLSRKFSEQNIGAPPSYEEVVSESRSPVHSERGGETPTASAPRASSPPTSTNPGQATSAQDASASPAKQEVEPSDEFFDPRGSVSGVPFGSVSAAPATSNNVEMDLLGSLSDSFSSNALANVPTTSPTTTFEPDAHANSGSATTFVATPSASNVMTQSFDDPFGDSPFRALPSSETVQPQPQTSTPTDSLPPTMNQGAANFPFGDSFSAVTYSAPGVSSVQTPTNSQFLPQEQSAEHNTDILADILPPPGPSPAMVTSQPPFSGPTDQLSQPSANVYGHFHAQPGAIVPHNQTGFAGQHSSGGFSPLGGPTAPITSHVAPQTPTGPIAQFNSGNFISQEGGFSVPNSGNFFPQQGDSTAPITSYMAPQTHTGPAVQLNGANFHPQQGSVSPVASHAVHQAPTRPGLQDNSDVLGNLFPQTGPNTSIGLHQALSSSTGALSIVAQPPKDKFEPKSAVWADTLSRGLVNFNISGAKINPLNDIGIDFDSINRKEKRMEKQPATPAISTVTMGKAMGSGSGIGRAGASVLRGQPNPMVGSGMGMGMGPDPGPGMGMGGGPGGGMGMGGYGGMNQPMGMGMSMGMRMNMGMGMQGPTGLPPGSNMPAGYNPMMGAGGYPQQQYGGGYR